MDEPMNSYQPVQTTDKENERRNTKKHRDHDDEVPGKEALTTDEKCCCSCLQSLDSPYLFVFWLSLVCFVLSASFSATGGGILSTIEKRFQLKTSQMAPFIICNDIVSIVLVLFVAHFGHKSHRPRFIGVGGVIIGVGFLLCTLPQFIYETPSQFSQAVSDDVTYQNQSEQPTSGNLYQVCLLSENTTGGTNTEVCTSEEQETSGSLMWQVSWIIIGQMLTGVGGAPMSPLAITYMDDNLDRNSLPIYIACLSVCYAVGPLVGFVISGYCLSIHADFLKAPVSAQPGDPNWIGAWWLTYATFGVLMILVSVPIALFPKRVRRRSGQEERRGQEEITQEQTEVTNGTGMHNTTTLHKSGKTKYAHAIGFFKALFRVATNVSYMAVIMGGCCYTVALIGNIVFMPKYLETQFSLPATTAPMIFGLTVTPGSLLGYIIGGIVVTKMKLTRKGMAGFVVILQPVILLVQVVFLFLGCDNRNTAGLTTDYLVNNTNIRALPNLTVGCNSGCACLSDYTPVCGSDGVTYATPCHAGCLATVESASTVEEGNITIYTNCSCVGASTDWLADDYYGETAIAGECPNACNTLIPFVAIAILSSTLQAVLGNTFFVVSVRAVDDDDRSLAIGLSSLMMRLLGVIPSPLIFGAAIQQACLLLQSSCGETGNCLLYDIVHFRTVYFALPLGLEFLGAIGYIVCYVFLKEPIKNEELPVLTSLNRNHVGTSVSQDENEDSDEDSVLVHYETTV
ncbi:solute carrier organic anion transporter family member 1B3-like [Asterias amurensis]|uniref:solute carrier organic anion transporter family member 1B3-like n=1 Tax=Asterias amurensis TaxID=7602 RepID=UPI003AB7C80C